MSNEMKEEIKADVRSILSSGGYVYCGNGIYERVKEASPHPLPVNKKKFTTRLLEWLTGFGPNPFSNLSESGSEK